LRKTAVANIDSLVEALDDAMRGGDLTRHRHDQDKARPLASLTQKQIDVMYLAADGKTNAQIAADREISVKAVEDILSRAASALGIHAAPDGNVRVAAVRKFLEGIGAPASIERDSRAVK
jgi:DNA-binding NarL/FixJ family response regulator